MQTRPGECAKNATARQTEHHIDGLSKTTFLDVPLVVEMYSCTCTGTYQMRSYLKFDNLHDASTSMGHGNKKPENPLRTYTITQKLVCKVPSILEDLRLQYHQAMRQKCDRKRVKLQVSFALKVLFSVSMAASSVSVKR